MLIGWLPSEGGGRLCHSAPLHREDVAREGEEAQAVLQRYDDGIAQHLPPVLLFSFFGGRRPRWPARRGEGHREVRSRRALAYDRVALMRLYDANLQYPRRQEQVDI